MIQSITLCITCNSKIPLTDHHWFCVKTIPNLFPKLQKLITQSQYGGESNTKEGGTFHFSFATPPPPSKDDRHPNPWNFAWSLKCCLCPLKKWNLKGSFLVSTIEKFVLLRSVGVQILSASFKKKKSEPPYSKTRHQLGGGGRYKMEHGVSGTDLWRLSDISAKSGTVGKK